MNFQFVPGKRKYLFITRKSVFHHIKPIYDLVSKEKYRYELLMIYDQTEFKTRLKDMEQNLKQQKMGTYLYVALPWAELSYIKPIIEKIGYSNEEVQYRGYGARKINVFCCRCHGVTEANDGVGKINCLHCLLDLNVSDHYSSLRDAYMGYVTIL